MLSEFADKDHPIRISSIPSLIRCPLQSALIHLQSVERDSGVAADTGTATHYAIAMYHKGVSVDSSLKQMTEALPTFPLADLEEAKKFVSHYTKDPRNAPEVCIEAEFQVGFTLESHVTDPTKAPIFFHGTCDQVRTVVDRDFVEVWDLKTGKGTGYEMLHHFYPQLAGYTLGVSGKYPNVRVGGIIRAMGYRARGKEKDDVAPDGVFFKSGLQVNDCRVILNRVQSIVAGIRRGELLPGPGEACQWCPYSGLGTCLPLANAQGLK